MKNDLGYDTGRAAAAARKVVGAALLAACGPQPWVEEREQWRPPPESSLPPVHRFYAATIATVDVSLPPLPAAGSGVALAARSSVRLGRGVISTAAVASGGDVFAADAVRAGKIVATRDILARSDSHLGDLEAGGETWLGSGSTAASRRTHAGMADRSLVHHLVEVPDAYEDVVERSGTHAVLLPGSYGAVTLAASSRTTLVPGKYFIRSLRASPGSTVVVSGASPVLVYVTDLLRLAALVDDGGDATRLRVFFCGTPTVELSSFRGTLIASRAEVDARGTFLGFLYGDAIDAGPTARFDAIPSPLAGVAPPLDAQGVPLDVMQDVAFTKPVAIFTDPNSSDTAGVFSAAIDWGDGSASLGTITGASGQFTVTGSHSYARTDPGRVSVTVVDSVTGVTTRVTNVAPGLTVYGGTVLPRPDTAGTWFPPTASDRP